MQIKPPKEKPKKYEQRKPRTPRKITPTYLHNSGLYYLQRFSASTQRFREVMQRKIKKSCKHHEDQEYDTCAALLEETIKTFLATDLLNDEVYTTAKVTSLRRAGKSTRFITSALRQKGIPPNLTTKTLKQYDALNDHIGKDAELTAAKNTARKKRLGPHRTKQIATEDLPDIKKKELGKMARAGFSYEIAKRALEEN